MKNIKKNIHTIEEFTDKERENLLFLEKIDKKFIVDYYSNIKSENIVLTSIILYPHFCEQIFSNLSVNAFRNLLNKKIFFYIKKIFYKFNNIDIDLIINELEKKDNNLKINEELKNQIITKLSNLLDLYSTSSFNFNTHLQILNNNYIRFKLLINSNKIIENCKNYNLDINTIVSLAEKQILDINNLKNIQTFNFDEYIKTFNTDTIVKKKNLKTNFDKLDSILLGLNPGELTVIAARTGVGKTAFSVSLINQVTMNNIKKILFFSLEMPYKHIMNRLISNITGVSLKSFVLNSFSELEKIQINKFKNQNKFVDLEVIDIPNINVFDIKNISQKFNFDNNLDLIIIDYLQLISTIDTYNANNRHLQISKICRELKKLSMSLKKPIIVLSQLNRSTLMSNTPALHNLKASGSIEEHCDNVLLLYRTDLNGEPIRNLNINNKNIQSSVDFKKYITLRIAKHRKGPLGKVIYNFIPHINKFVEL